MKILFAVQGTGNGHLSRAKDIYPELQKYGTVDLLVSGCQADVVLPYEIKYRMQGLSFIFGKHGGVSLGQTLRKLNPLDFLKDVHYLPVEEYDLVVNDFEPVSAWACKLRKVPCVALSHQSAVIHPSAPRPHRNGWLGKWILKHYAPFDYHYGFHFTGYDENTFTPVIRKEVQALNPVPGEHYTVYLPAYNDASLIRFLHRFKQVEWEIFSKHNKEAFRFENLNFRPIENRAFLESLSSCAGALLGAGFEGPAEALFLGKKLMVIPMKRQYEQQCNAAAISELGVPVVHSLSSATFKRVAEWIDDENKVDINFPKETAAIVVHKMIEDFINKTAQAVKPVPRFF